MVRIALKFALIPLVLMVLTVSDSFAMCPVCKKACSGNTNWPERSANQLLQGLVNVGTGWTLVFTGPFRENADNPNPDAGYKMGNGLLKGSGEAAIATGAGLLEVVTFWTPVRIIPDSACPICPDGAKKSCCPVSHCSK